MIEFLSGSARLFLPLFCVAFGALCYARVGIFNLALDGQITLASIVYVLLAAHSWPSVAVLGAISASWFVGAILIELHERFQLNVLLVGIGLLYISIGGSRLLCKIIAGNPSYAMLGGGGIGSVLAAVLIVLVCILAAISLHVLRPLRLARVIGSGRDVAVNEGIPIRKWTHVHNGIAAVMVGLAATYLIEHGGSFSHQISGQRGFLALAMITIGEGSLWALALLSLLFAGGQKFAYTVQFSSEMLEMSPYLLAIALMALLHKSRQRRDESL